MAVYPRGNGSGFRRGPPTSGRDSSDRIVQGGGHRARPPARERRQPPSEPDSVYHQGDPGGDRGFPQSPSERDQGSGHWLRGRPVSSGGVEGLPDFQSKGRPILFHRTSSMDPVWPCEDASGATPTLVPSQVPTITRATATLPRGSSPRLCQAADVRLRQRVFARISASAI